VLSIPGARSRAALVVIVVLLAGGAFAQPLPPELTRPVNDFASVIDPDSARQLESMILALERASGDAIVVATIDTFEPYADIREYAVKMFENRGKGLGQRGKDNGLLVLIAIKDRDAWMEVGYDLEEFITDGFAGETIREDMAPLFREGRYGPGLVAGVSRVIERIAERRGVSLQGQPPRRERRRVTGTGSGGNIIVLVFIAFLVINAIAGRLRGGGRRRRWGGGSGWHSGVGPFGGGFGGFGGGGGGGFGGGFGGFGGGRSGGGGGGGSW
jgi:uncharacterized protein